MHAEQRIDDALVDAVARELTAASRPRPFCKTVFALQRAAAALGIGSADERARLRDETQWLTIELEALYDRLTMLVRRGERLTGQGNFGDDECAPAHPNFNEVTLSRTRSFGIVTAVPL